MTTIRYLHVMLLCVVYASIGDESSTLDLGLLSPAPLDVCSSIGDSAW